MLMLLTHTDTHWHTFCCCCCWTGWHLCCACNCVGVCVSLCEWVWHVSDICLKVFWQPLLDIHWKHIHHTHTKTDTHTTRHITHTPITHRHSQPLHQLLAQTFWFVFSANSSTHTLPHTQCTDPRFTHTSKKLIKMRCADIVVRSSPSSSPFASLPSITAKNKV